LDSEGPVETARQGRDVAYGEDRKVDQVVKELCRYGVKVAGLQETKWFGSAVYRVSGCVVLAAGRPVPAAGETLQRGEGVALVLADVAIKAWREAGEQWRMWSSRLVSVQLKIGRGKKNVLHVFSCYAPTRAASRAEKIRFYGDLQQALSTIPSGESYILLGDFNARVGARETADDIWGDVRGPHGYGELNDAGKEFLAFLCANEATICNTWFSKKDIHKQTWQHPKSKKWHCIDFAVMRQKDRLKCLDARVMRGAVCHTDHQLLVVKVMVTGKGLHRETSSRVG
jgi:hypothetical protein